VNTAHVIPSEVAYIGDSRVETPYGWFDPLRPVFDIRDIAHSLGQLARYNGHAKRFYSVAEHSVLVSKLVEKLDLGDPFDGLMHDATEAYLSDVPSPLKQMLPDFREFDARMETALRLQYGLGEHKAPGIKTADWLALFIEAADLMPSKGEGWRDPNNLRPQALELRDKGWKIVGHYPNMATLFFNKRLCELRPQGI
jgi:uncharacterized protein